MSEYDHKPFPREHLPTVPEVVAVLKMCSDHDIPLDKLPKLWDEHQNLQQIERRAGIQNGNMDREIKRLRGLVAELDAQLRDERARETPDGNQLALYAERIKDLESTERKLEDQIRELENKQREQDAAMQEQADRYSALLARCKHFEGLADQKRIDELEDFIAHYRCGMEGMKVLADLRHFSHQFRLCLIRKTLYTFEPSLKLPKEPGEDA